jgi:hypothetical protein
MPDHHVYTRYSDSFWKRNGFNAGTLSATIAIILTLLKLANSLEARLTALEVKVNPLWSAYTGRQP